MGVQAEITALMPEKKLNIWTNYKTSVIDANKKRREARPRARARVCVCVCVCVCACVCVCVCVCVCMCWFKVELPGFKQTQRFLSYWTTDFTISVCLLQTG
jgi:hypothetical protein